VVRVINNPDRKCFSLTGGLRVINNPDCKYGNFILMNRVSFFYQKKQHLTYIKHCFKYKN